jgi:hypothetical protein
VRPISRDDGQTAVVGIPVDHLDAGVPLAQAVPTAAPQARAVLGACGG